MMALLLMVTEVMLGHSSKELTPKSVTLLGIEVFLQPTINVLVAVSMIALQLFRESYMGLTASTLIVVSLELPLNALSPMLVTLSGMVILVSSWQLAKAISPMLVTLYILPL